MEILRFKSSSWLITLDGIPIVVDAVFSSAKNWDVITEDEKRAHKAEIFICTQGNKKHFDLSSYKYIPQDKSILVPMEYLSKARKFLNHPLIGMGGGETFSYKSLKITATPTGNSLFDPFLIGKANCYVYRIEGDEGLVVVSGYAANASYLKTERPEGKKLVYIVPFGQQPAQNILGGPLFSVLKLNEIHQALNGDFLIPFSEDPGNVALQQMLPLVRGQEHEKSTLFVETGQKININ